MARRWGRLREPERADAYVRKAIYRQQISRWRLRSWGREVATDSVPERVQLDGTGQVDLRLRSGQALAALPPRQRAVIVLRYYEDRSESQVADLLGLSVGTVRSHGHRGLLRLRELCRDLVARVDNEEVNG